MSLRKHSLFFICLGMLLLMVSCKSSKSVFRTSEGAFFTGEEHMEALLKQTPVYESFSARIKLTVPTKKSTQSVNGTLKIQRNELIQLSLLMPLIRTEIVRIDITPEYILLIDRLKKRYAKVPVSQLNEMFQVDLDFYMLQALFSNEVFLKGRYNLKPKDISSFKTEILDDDELGLYTVLSHPIVCAFFTSLTQHHLAGTSITTTTQLKKLEWDYQDFVPLASGMFPSKMKIIMSNGKQSIETLLELSRMQTDKQEIAATDVPARYEELSLKELLKMLD